MKHELKERWVAALRSGTYKQGEGYLKSHKEEYCCLGVLMCIASEDGLVPLGQQMPSSDVLYKLELEIAAAGRLAEMNDNGLSFSFIADYIESTL